jgi:hypothetical protein
MLFLGAAGAAGWTSRPGLASSGAGRRDANLAQIARDLMVGIAAFTSADGVRERLSSSREHVEN